MSNPAIALGVKDAMSAAIKGALANVTTALSAVKDVAVQAGKGISGLGKAVGGVLQGILTATSIIKTISQTIFFTTGALFYAFRIVGQIVGGIAALFRGLFAIGSAIVGAVRAVVGAVVSIVQSVASSLGSLFSSIEGKLGTVVKYSLGGVVGIGAILVGVAAGAERAWSSVRDTIARIRIAGIGEGMIAEMRRFADSIRHATTIASSEILKLTEMAVRLRVPEEQLKAVTATAVGLSKALGISLESALTKAAAAMHGDTSALKTLIPQLNGVTDAAERLTIVKAVAQQGFAMANGQVSTFAGLWAQLRNILASNAQALGEKIAPGIKLIVDAIQPVLPMLESTGEAFANLFNWLAEAITPAIKFVVEGFRALVVGIRAAGQTLVESWRVAWDLVKTTLEYTFEVIKGIVVHFFTQTLPTAFNWFTGTAKTWLGELGNGLSTGFQNMFANLMDVAVYGWHRIIGYLIGGEELSGAQLLRGFKAEFSRSLTEGFTGFSAALPLPEFSARVASEAERALGNHMKSTSDQLATDFAERFSAMVVDLNKKLVLPEAKRVQKQIEDLAFKKNDGAAAGSGATGSNLLESRFRVGGTGGLSMTDQLLEQMHRTQKEQMRQQWLQDQERRREARALLAAQRQGFAVQPII